MRWRRLWACGLAALAIGQAGCRRQPPAASAPAVATFDGGTVTAAEVDRAILDLPPGQRQPADGDLLTWYEHVAREVAVQSVLLAEARRAGLDREPEFERARNEARRQAVVAVYLEKELPPIPAPTPLEIEVYYREHAKEYRRPPARETYHLFRRVPPGGDPAPVMAEMRRLRERVLAGEDFGTLAAEFSESESRHQKGLIGWVTPGKVGPDLERAIYSLQPRVPSQPLKTAQGIHLLFVSAETPGQTLTLPEVRNGITTLLNAQRRRAAIDRLIGTTPLPDAFIPSTDELRALFAAGDPGAVAFRAGDYELTLAQVQALVLSGRIGTGLGDTPAHTLLVTMEQRERAYRLALQKGVDRTPEAQALVERILDRELAAVQLRKRLAERVDRDPTRLQEYYEANRTRFSTPLRLRVERLAVPLGANANEVMARLERARPELDARRTDLRRLAAEVGGTVLDPVWELPTQVARRERRAPAAAVGLQAGRSSPPYRTQDHIEMVWVVERAEPQPQAFDRIREQVRTDLLLTHREDEYGALVKEVLAQRHYTVVRSELEAMLRRPGAGA